MLRPRHALHAYQNAAIAFLQAARSRFLISIMGSGKTAIALHTVIDIKRKGELNGPILVCAPLLVASTVWDAELAAWQDTAGLRLVKLLGTPKQRLAMLDRILDTDILVVNYDLVDWLLRQVVQRDLRFGLVIADEASALKTPDARRTRALLALAGRAERRWALTGTPRGAGLLDVWGPSMFCTNGVAFPPFTVWRDAGFVPIDQYARHWVPRAGVEAAVIERMKLFTCVVDRTALATRPPVTTILHQVPMPEVAWEIYAQIDNGTTADLQALSEAGIDPPHEMAIVGKLQQVLGGAIYHDNGEAWRPIHDARLDALEALHNGHDRPTLVYFAFRHELARIRARFPQAIELAPQHIAAWNRGEIDMLLAHPQSAAHGVNLQTGTDTVVFFNLGWSAERYEQAVARVARQGQRDPVTVYVMVTPDSIDTIAWATIQRRIAEQARTVEAIEAGAAQSSLR